jgi:hypothetical protein
MEIVVEVVAARAQRRQVYDDRLAGLDGFFAIEPEALEFNRLLAALTTWMDSG